MKKREHKWKGNAALHIGAGVLYCAFLLCGFLFLGAVLISTGVMGMDRVKEIATIFCILSVLIGSCLAMRGCAQKQLWVGVGVGAGCFAVLLIAAFVCAERGQNDIDIRSLLISSLGMGSMAGFIGKKRKKRRR